MPSIALLLLLAALMSSCATVPVQPPPPDESLQQHPLHDGTSRSLYLYSRARLAALEGDYPAALVILRDALERDPSSAFLHTAMAELKLKIGQGKEALEYIDKAIKLDPAYRPPYLIAGSLLAATGKDLEAAGYLRTAIQLDPTKEEAYFQLVISLMHLYEYEEAVSTLKSLIKINSDSALGYYYLGKTYGQMKLYRDAVVYFKKTLELRPEFDQAAIDMAATYEAMGDYSSAIETYKQLVGDDEIKAIVLQRLIQLLIQQRRFTDALEYLQLAVDAGYGGQETMRKIGLIHLELEQYDEAIKIFSTMLEKDPAAHQVRLYLGMALEENGDLDAAFAEFSKIPRDASIYVDAIGHIAFILKEKGEPMQAVETIKAAIVDNPHQIELYLNLSSLYEALEKPEDGLALLLEAEKQFEKDPRLQFRIGVLYDKLGKRAESIERMQKVLALNPKDAQALNFIGYTYAEMGINLDEALSYLKKAVEIRPNDGFILDSLGWVYFKLKKYDEAARNLEDAVALVTDDSTIVEHLGDVYLARREYKKALTTYRKGLEIDPDRKELADKIRRVKGEQSER
ncbi:MAG: tetratricopeptide repeat protein [Desulfuromonadales bacterium]|nr:tetratricopeptide repeat protein [Desulfuromonadales bacterium]